MVYVFLAEGFEECEALAPVDILSRGGIEVKTVGVTGKTVSGSHNITVVSDITENEVNITENDAVILPGGMPGTTNLLNSEAVKAAVLKANELNCIIGAICAAPSVLGQLGLLNGKKATCFPGFEDKLTGALVTDAPVVKDGNIITSHGAGAAYDFGFELLTALTGDKAKTEKLKQNMLYRG